MIDRLSTVLPEPDSPTTPRVLAPGQGERDAVDGPDEPPAGAERGVQVLDLEERALDGRPRRGSSGAGAAPQRLTGSPRGGRSTERSRSAMRLRAVRSRKM